MGSLLVNSSDFAHLHPREYARADRSLAPVAMCQPASAKLVLVPSRNPGAAGRIAEARPSPVSVSQMAAACPCASAHSTRPHITTPGHPVPMSQNRRVGADASGNTVTARTPVVTRAGETSTPAQMDDSRMIIRPLRTEGRRRYSCSARCGTALQRRARPRDRGYRCRRRNPPNYRQTLVTVPTDIVVTAQ